jgi:isopentenyldiphosphate isomerase
VGVGDELVDLIDEHDRVIGQVTRARMRREHLLHRVVAVLCFDAQGRLYIHRRTASKDLFPSLYDMFVAGTVGAGEAYEPAAVRELCEELGVHGAPLTRLFHHRYEGPDTRSHSEVFRATWDGPIVHQASEIDWGEFRSLSSIQRNLDGYRFVPDGAELFARYMSEFA